MLSRQASTQRCASTAFSASAVENLTPKELHAQSLHDRTGYVPPTIDSTRHRDHNSSMRTSALCGMRDTGAPPNLLKRTLSGLSVSCLRIWSDLRCVSDPHYVPDLGRPAVFSSSCDSLRSRISLLSKIATCCHRDGNPTLQQPSKTPSFPRVLDRRPKRLQIGWSIALIQSNPGFLLFVTVLH